MRATLQPAPAFASPRVRAAACGPRAAFARPVLEQLIVVEGTRDAEAVRQAVTTQRTPLPREGPLSPPDDVRRRVEEAPWRGGLEPCGDVAFTLSSAQIEGKLPAELRGTLYRAGPGRIRVGPHQYGHWFDGDGAMTALALDGTTQSVRVTSRLVETPRLAAQRAAGDAAGFPLRGAWTQATQWHRNIFGIPTNPSNTSVLRWAGKLMALCEGGAPMELDPETLATRGPVVFSGQERQLAVLGFNAHFKIDPEDGVLYNCGVQLPSSLRVFALGPDGRERAATAVNFSAGELAFVHDWAMSARHLVLFIPPWVCAPLDALAAVAGLRALGHAFAWRAGRGTRCVVLRKADLAIVHDSEIADAFSGYHFCNAWEEGALLKVHVNRLIGTRDALEANFSAMYDAVWRRENYNELWEYTIDLAAPGGRVLGGAPVLSASVNALPMEFPIINHRFLGRKHRYVYTTAFTPQASYFGALQKYDLETGAVQTRVCAAGEYPSEACFVPSADKGAPEDAGFILFLVYVAARHATDLYVLDAQRFEDAPLAVCRLPSHIPYTFHGWFENAAAANV